MDKGFFRRLFSRRTDKVETPQTVKAPSAPKLTKPQAPPIYMKVSFATDIGKVRKSNQDNFYIDGKYRHVYGKNECDSYIELTEKTHVFGLFDGMGGEAFGETASALAAVHLDRISPTLAAADSSELPYYMNEYARQTNNAICDMLEERDAMRGGSTFTAVCVKDRTAYPFYLGDSRIYLYESDGLMQITEDQTLAVRKIKAGVYTEEESKGSPDNHKLTCYLGADRAGMGLDSQPCMPIRIEPGMKIIMCSDGLSDMCSRSELRSVIESNPENTARALVDKALENGGIDNVTCVAVEFDGFF